MLFNPLYEKCNDHIVLVPRRPFQWCTTLGHASITGARLMIRRTKDAHVFGIPFRKRLLSSDIFCTRTSSGRTHLYAVWILKQLWIWLCGQGPPPQPPPSTVEIKGEGALGTLEDTTSEKEKEDLAAAEIKPWAQGPARGGREGEELKGFVSTVAGTFGTSGRGLDQWTCKQERPQLVAKSGSGLKSGLKGLAIPDVALGPVERAALRKVSVCACMRVYVRGCTCACVYGRLAGF
jgi:hypothetical protein